MASFQELWQEYGRDRRPANIGAVVNGVRIGDLDDEIQDVAGSFAGLGSAIDAARVARLGNALDQLMLVLPSIEPAETRSYFERLARLARAALAAIATHEA
jgi:hypothetical protein